MKPSTESIPQSMWIAALLVSSQSFLFGYVFSCLNSCLVTGDNNSAGDCFNGKDSSCPKGTIYNDLDLNTFEAQLATSLVIAGAWLGCLAGSKPSELYGRKFTLLANNTFFILGAVLSSIGNFYTLFFGRFISGIGVGIASVVPPVLLSEMATVETRGTITTMHQVMVTLAIFFASIFAYGVVTYVSHGWQYVQAFTAFPALITIFLRQYIPESPKWLLMKRLKTLDIGNVEDSVETINLSPITITANAMQNPFKSSPSPAASVDNSRGTYHRLSHEDSITIHRTEKREDADLSVDSRSQVVALLARLRLPGHDIDKEIQTIINDARGEESPDDVTWNEVFACKRAVIIGCGLMFFQAITGINSVTFYSTTIFGLAGFTESILGTASFGAVNFITTIVATNLVDKMGRRALLTFGTYLMFFSLIILSSVLLSNAIPSATQGILAVLAVLSFVVGFAIGLGAVVWVLMSEIMPTRLRVKAMSLFLSINWATNLVIAFLTLTAIDELGGVTSDMNDDQSAAAEKKGVAYIYFIFAGFTAIFIAFIHTYVPETKGKSQHELENMNSPLMHFKDQEEDGTVEA